MARARNIKPSFFTNEYLSELQPLARLLFIGLWCFADREGRLEDRPKRLRVDILPYDDCDVDALLEGLANSPDKFILRYEVDGVRYIQVLNFNKHQNPHVKEQGSTIPAPSCGEEILDKNSADTGQAPDMYGANIGQAPEQSNRESVIGNRESERGNQKEEGLIPCKEIISYLNEKAGTSYRHTTQKTKDLINARFNEKFIIDDFYTVIDKKVDEWLGTEWQKFLRPETLFSNKFEGYLNQKITKSESNNPFA